EARDLRRAVHRTGLRVTGDVETFQFNTMIAALMELTNQMQRLRDAGRADRAAWEDAVERLLLMLAPSCPHIAEELWERTGRPYSVHQQPWPEFDPGQAREETVRLAVQVNGRVRGHIDVPADADEAAVRAAADAEPNVREHIEGRPVARVVYVPGRLLNLVLG